MREYQIIIRCFMAWTKERDDFLNRKANSCLIAQQAMKAMYDKEVNLEKNLSTMLEDLTEVRFDIERVRLLVSLVFKREKLKY